MHYYYCQYFSLKVFKAHTYKHTHGCHNSRNLEGFEVGNKTMKQKEKKWNKTECEREREIERRKASAEFYRKIIIILHEVFDNQKKNFTFIMWYIWTSVSMSVCLWSVHDTNTTIKTHTRFYGKKKKIWTKSLTTIFYKKFFFYPPHDKDDF